MADESLKSPDESGKWPDDKMYINVEPEGFEEPRPTEPDQDHTEPINQDQLILEQERQIAEEIKASSQMIGDRTDLTPLQEQFACDAVYTFKVSSLLPHYSHFRRTRPDGNCFFRGFLFAYLERCIALPEELARFKKNIEDSKQELFDLGFPQFTTEDFHDTFVATLEEVASSPSLELITSILNDAGRSDYLVVYLRLMVSAHLQKNRDFYAFFVDGGRTIEEFCKTEVEPMYRECDHLHIVALTSSLEVPVGVVYLDRGDGETTDPHVFPQSSQTPVLHLLYRPGHYDILYKKPDPEPAQT